METLQQRLSDLLDEHSLLNSGGYGVSAFSSPISAAVFEQRREELRNDFGAVALVMTHISGLGQRYQFNCNAWEFSRRVELWSKRMGRHHPISTGAAIAGALLLGLTPEFGFKFNPVFRLRPSRNQNFERASNDNSVVASNLATKGR